LLLQTPYWQCVFFAAVALETSITAQRNWYHAASNGKDFVKFVVKQVEKAKHQAKQRSNR